MLELAEQISSAPEFDNGTREAPIKGRRLRPIPHTQHATENYLNHVQLVRD